MKKFRKLVPAFAMLLVSATVLASTTFAWFSMNNKVTATGMEVTAKANTQYLVIAKTAAEITTTGTTAITLPSTGMTVSGGMQDGTTYKVYPVSKNTSGDKMTVGTLEIANNAWYTANSNQHNVSGGSTVGNLTNAKLVTIGATDYFRCYTFFIGLSKDSTDDFNKAAAAGNKLQMEAKNLSTLADGNDTSAVKAVVVVNGQEYLLGNNDTADIDSFTLEKDSPLEVKVYLYIDGVEDAVKDDNATKLAGKLDIEFTLVYAPQA